ncbi:hypothetical protein EMPS_11159 [Entomortierella parvispora]|uniref:Shieldin complex subunit 2 first OB fold domain-containing protein n=1 Tax=Entomortierella parvispora TaxID=205924 RepID=A0A9P3HLJ4_9FUNG|nr:hypothetical protein EMPS_11159 [Entomortierella parvispora]
MLPPTSARKQVSAPKGVRPSAASTSASSNMQEQDGRPGLKRDFSDIIPSTFPTNPTMSVSFSRTSSSETTSSSWDFDLNPGQNITNNRDQLSVDTDQTTYDESTSPIIPSLSPPPRDNQPHLPLLSPVLIQPSRKPAKTATRHLKNHYQRPQEPSRTLEEDLDPDPIADFDSDEDSNSTTVAEVMDEPILNSLAPTTASAMGTAWAPSKSHRKKTQNPRGRGALLQPAPSPLPPQRPQHLVSPGRQKFHVPLPSPAKQDTAPSSPARPLRPVSELSRIFAAVSPASSSTTTTSTNSTTSIPPPPTETYSSTTVLPPLRQRTNSGRLATHIATLKTTTMANAVVTVSVPKLRLTDIARSFRLPTFAPGHQKVSPSGPKAHHPTNEIKDEQRVETRTRYNESNNSRVRADQGVGGNTSEKRKATDSLSGHRESPKWNHVKQEQDREGSKPEKVTTRPPQSQTPGSASTEYDDTSPIIPVIGRDIPLVDDHPLPVARTELLSTGHEKQSGREDQEKQRREKERKKQELLSEVYAMRRTLKQSSSSESTSPPLILPPPPPATSTSPASTEKPAPIHSEPISDKDRIPIPEDILEYAPKLTPIDQIKWAPVKEGRYHIFALVMAIEPMEVIAAKAYTSNSSRSFQKVLVSVCDQSTTSFKVVLWREKADWIYLFKPGDAVLFTDLQMKEYRNKISGNSSSWSRMTRLDGSVMSRYKGSKDNRDDPAATTIESTVQVFMEKRRVLALDLLDPDKGIARAPSCYLSPSMSLFSPPQHPQEQGFQQIGPGTTASVIVKSTPGPVTTPSTSIARPPTAKGSILPLVASGASIRASVVYRMLIAPNDDSAGWEIGAVMANGRFVKVQSTSNAPMWITKIVPGKLMNFFGKFTKLNDGTVVFSLDGARDPASLSENAWGNSIKQIELKRFRSIRSLREHQFMGDALVEEATIFAVRFYNLTSNYNVDDNDQEAMFSFIQCYCKGCSSPAVASPQNPSILFCPHCHLDPQRRQTSTLEWYYPPFEITLTDRTNISRLGASLSMEMIQVRCQMELGNQVFAEVPADKWMTSGDEADFWKCRDQWVQIMRQLNNANSESDEDNVEEDRTSKDSAQGQPGPLEVRKKKVKAEVRVGLNFAAKGLSIHYL